MIQRVAFLLLSLAIATATLWAQGSVTIYGTVTDAAGAVVGRVLGGSGKGAVIGGVIGGAVGAQRAVETKDRDVVLPAGSAVTITLNDTFQRS